MYATIGVTAMKAKALMKYDQSVAYALAGTAMYVIELSIVA